MVTLRYPRRITAVLTVSLVTTLGTPWVAGASISTIKQTQAELQAISAKLSALTQASERSANAYDAALGVFGQLSDHIAALQKEIRTKRAAIAKTKARMVVDLVHAYVDSTAGSQIVALFNQNVTSSDARGVFGDFAVGNLNAERVTLINQRTALNRSIRTVVTQRHQAKLQSEHLQALLSNNLAAEQSAQNTLNQVSAQLANEKTAFIAYEVRQGGNAAKARDIAGEEQAVNAASQIGGQAAANQVIEAIRINTPPPPIHQIPPSVQGSAALRAAESQIGVPYVWGGTTPGVGFDCSGLVQWAWQKAGVTIPRTTEQQWAALPHVSFSDIRPGDLIYYFNLDGDNAVDHVVMYAGSGPWGTSTTIAAARTGVPISLAPYFGAGFLGVARP
jgi:cell wall-associated NlpC family hydrolase